LLLKGALDNPKRLCCFAAWHFPGQLENNPKTGLCREHNCVFRRTSHFVWKLANLHI